MRASTRRLSAAVLVAWLGLPALADEPYPPEPPVESPAPPSWRQPPPPDQSESLPDLLARVLPRDPQVRVAQSLMAAADERARQALSRMGPVLAVSGSQGRSQDRDFGADIERRIDRSEGTLRWNLYNYGNDAAELSGARRDVVAAREAVRQAREEVAERLADAYAGVLRVQDLLPRSQARLDSVIRLVEQVQRQAEAGKVSQADAQQAQASLLDAQIAHEQLVSDLESARQRLAALAGGEARSVLPVTLAPDLLQAAARVDLAPLPGQVAAANERAAAARLRVRPLASLLAPRIDFEYRQRLSDRTTPQVTSQQRDGWQVTARWDFPVLGENQARRAEGERRAEAVEAEAERVLLSVQSERATLPARLAIAQRAVAQLDRQIEQYQGLLRAGELQYEAGRRSLTQLVQLHESLFNAEQRRAEQLARILATQLRQLSLGGSLLPALAQAQD
jgi:outer membrane protein TolC